MSIKYTFLPHVGKLKLKSIEEDKYFFFLEDKCFCVIFMIV